MLFNILCKHSYVLLVVLLICVIYVKLGLMHKLVVYLSTKEGLLCIV